MPNEVLFDLLGQSGSIVPIRSEKKSIRGWDRFQTQPPSHEELRGWVESGDYEGYGLMMGYGGYHCLDLDTKNMPDEAKDKLFEGIWSGIPDPLKERLVVQRTRGGGEHIIYRCAAPCEDAQLVTNPETGRPVVETIGPRNYLLIEPSPGYRVVSGSLSSVPELTTEEHDWLIKHAQMAGIFTSLFKTTPSEQPAKSERPDIFIWGDDPSETEPAQPITVTALSTTGSVSKTELPTLASRETNPIGYHFVSASAAMLERQGIDITANYDDWVRLGYAAANEAGEDGRELYHKISRQNPDYSEQETDQVFNSILNGGATDKATGASLRYLMEQNQVQSEMGNKTAFKTKVAIEHVRGKGLRRNLFSNKVECLSGMLLTDSDVDSIYLELRMNGVGISKGDVMSVINSDRIVRYDPLKDWLADAEEKADDRAVLELLECFQLKTTDPARQKFLRGMIIKWLMQVPAMILSGHPPRLVLVLIGETYIGKSELFRRLLPPSLRKYYAESALDRDKDSEILMSEHLVINVDELAGVMKSPHQLERFKALSSAQQFTLRVPYGKINERFPRKAILCGTSNKIDIIQDHDTGNSRIIPVELSDIDKERYNSIDRDALFGALARKYRELGTGYLRLTTDELEMLKKESEEYTTINVEQELIQRHLRPCPDQFLTVTEICGILASHTTLPINPRYISREMNKLGFAKTRKRVNGSHLHGFFANPTSTSTWSKIGDVFEFPHRR